MNYLVFLLSLCAIVVVHELGHYLVARCFDVAVDVFSIGFGPAVWRYKVKSSTEFRLSPILLGGYVRFSESLENKKQQKLITDISWWRQILILLAGPFANLGLAFMGLLLFFKIGGYVLIPYIGDVAPLSYANQLGLEKGSKIIAVNELPVYSWEDVFQEIKPVNSRVKLTIVRPQSNERFQIDVEGVTANSFFEKLGIVPLNPAIPAIIGSVVPDSAASKAGLRSGDEIKSIDGHSIKAMSEVSDYVSKHPNKKLKLSYVRQGKLNNIEFTSDSIHENQQTYGRLGVSSLGFEHFPQWFVYHQDNWQQAIVKTFSSIQQFLQFQLTVWFHLNDQISQLSGPVGMAKAASEAWTVSLKMFLMYCVWLNIGLAVVNLLPIPILDGGQCLLLILRKIFPKIFTEERQKHLLLWSLIFIIGLFVVGLFNDLSI